MSEKLDPAQLATLQQILADWDIPAADTIMQVARGHPVFKIITPSASFSLKESSSAPNLHRLAFTHTVLTHVAACGIQVSVPLRTRSGQYCVSHAGQTYVLAPFLEAGSASDDPAQQGELFFYAGQAIARLHQALASYADPDVQHATWRDDFAAQIAGWIDALGAGLPPAQAAIVHDLGQRRGTAIAEAMQGLPEQLIHRDCHPGNMVFNGTRVVGFIDCDHLCVGARIFDLAYYAVHYLKWETATPAATEAWLTNLPQLIAGYTTQNRLLQVELDAFPFVMMTYHVLLAHWFLNLPRMEPIDLEIQALTWLDQRHVEVVHAVSQWSCYAR